MQKSKMLAQVGKTAPSFELMSTKGSNLNLESFRNTWVLLNFWDSWRGRCIKGIHKLKEVFIKYKFPLQVIGIACNESGKNWRKAVQKHQLPWINLFSNKQVEIDYAIEAYPPKILIYPQGLIRLGVTREIPSFHEQIQEIIKNQIL